MGGRCGREVHEWREVSGQVGVSRGRCGREVWEGGVGIV